MIYTLFYSRLQPLDGELTADYERRNAELRARAEADHPGFVDAKTFVAEDGERLTVVRFRDEESQRRWRLDPIHQEAQRRGRSDYYAHYRIVLCDEVRSHNWTRSLEEAQVEEHP